LADAGWRLGPDGIRVKDGKRLEFTVMVSNDPPERAQLAQVWQADLRAVGIALHVRTADFQAVLAATNGPPSGWEAAMLYNQVVGLPDGNGQYDTGGSYAGGYANPHMDELIHASVDKPGTEGLFAYEDFAAEEQPVTTLPEGEFSLMVANRVGGADRLSNPEGFWTPEELWVRDEGCGQPAGNARR
jgi:peptide/nickel transport system substrate-binding protein